MEKRFASRRVQFEAIALDPASTWLLIADPIEAVSLLSKFHIEIVVFREEANFIIDGLIYDAVISYRFNVKVAVKFCSVSRAKVHGKGNDI